MVDGELIDIEAAGVHAGLNPMFGRYNHKFLIAPVSYSAPAAARQVFTEKVRAEIGARYVFSSFVKLSVLLHLQMRDLYESDRYGDLDNYAKSINDTLKGKDGILIDDCQIQELVISWIDGEHSSFELEIQGVEDEFVYKDGLRLYEMPDGLYYPQSSFVWSRQGPEQITEIDMYCGLQAFAHAAYSKKQFRHLLRQGGATPREGFQEGQMLASIQIGFHRSRAISSGFELVAYQDWQTTWDSLKSDTKGGNRVRQLDELFKSFTSGHKMLAMTKTEIREHLKNRRETIRKLQQLGRDVPTPSQSATDPDGYI